MFPILIVLCALLNFGKSQSLCPENVKCLTSESADTCPEGTWFLENVKVFGCCPGCVKRQEKGEPCDDTQLCAPGLKCDATSLCADDKTQACEYNKRKNKATLMWKPQCSKDGLYAPKQCKGEKMNGKCFCVDPKGKRIFGDSPWSKAENMTCACSRQVSQMTREDVSIHCNEIGNFEYLQCDDGVCWCADDKTGVPYTSVVPEKMAEFLPCYVESEVGSMYLRKCDSEKVGQARLKKTMELHGTSHLAFSYVHCNYDGSYAKVQKVGVKQTCNYRDNSFIMEVAVVSDSNTCQCAYDQFVAKQNGENFPLVCDTRGFFAPTQTSGNLYYCVDQDGFPTTQATTTKPTCLLQ